MDITGVIGTRILLCGGGRSAWGKKFMSEEFKVGDVVALRSSSHIRMTVVNVDARAAGDECVCVWFDLEQNIHHGRFPMAALVIPFDKQ